VSDKNFLLAGKTEPGAKMTAGNADVLLAADGSFTQEVELKTGQNRITIGITDKAGNTLTKTITITYNEPVVSAGWFLPLLVVIVVAGAVGAGGFLHMRRKKGARPLAKMPKGRPPSARAPQPRAPPAIKPKPRAPPPVPPPTPQEARRFRPNTLF
jgi:hypothetical protein